MSRASTWLLDYRRDVYSQTGEDGVLEKIIDVLPHTDGWCVEFGAWDGRHLSNTSNLIEHSGYRAVLIEAEPRRFEELAENFADRPGVLVANRRVGFDERTSLDRILEGEPVPTDFDLLSIDIDGNDYHAWRAVEAYAPKVVCIEFNPTIPTEVRYVQPADPAVAHGSSLRSVVELGKEKGYELVCVLSYNAILVRSDFFPLFEISDNRPEVMRTDLQYVTYIFSGYDGTVILKGGCRLPWHKIDMKPSRTQAVPRILRKNPHDFNRLQRVFHQVFRVMSDPGKYFPKVWQRIRRSMRV